MTKVDRAAEFARKAHEGGFRRDNKTPYIVHPADVVSRLKSWGITDEDILSAAWLHDTVEDTDVKIADIEGEFGNLVADYVWSLTKQQFSNRDISEAVYIEKLKKAPMEAKLIKLADIMSNLSDMHNIPNLDYKFEKYMAKKIRYMRAVSENWNES